VSRPVPCVRAVLPLGVDNAVGAAAPTTAVTACAAVQKVGRPPTLPSAPVCPYRASEPAFPESVSLPGPAVDDVAGSTSRDDVVATAAFTLVGSDALLFAVAGSP
jgi:hypothetical protein